MTDKITVGVIGAGRIGKIHVSNIVYYMPEARVKTIADANLTPEIEAWAKNLGIPHVTNNAEDIFGDPEISVVLICSSTDTHADYIIKAARSGKNIFCEKPVDLSVEKVKKALAVVKEAGVRLQIGFNRRFDHNFAHVRKLIDDGAIGQVQLVKITSRDPAPPPISYVKVSGGIFLDMTIHDFDMARFQAKSEVEEVYAQGAVLIDPEIGKAGDVDTAIIMLKFTNGALGVIDNSRKAVYGYDQRVEVFGSAGAAAAENDTPSQVRLSDTSGVHADKPLYFFLERYKDAYIEEMKAFFKAIKEGTETPVTGQDGLMDLAIGLAAKKSLAEHRPVKIFEVL
ncbi:MAG TPA: inositol 2-dehydrogenase [Rectinema sp.]|nr:inositol 2-dehydrogenase [Rectinema sp.]